jgi:hypothetical protein
MSRMNLSPISLFDCRGKEQLLFWGRNSISPINFKWCKPWYLLFERYTSRWAPHQPNSQRCIPHLQQCARQSLILPSNIVLELSSPQIWSIFMYEGWTVYLSLGFTGEVHTLEGAFWQAHRAQNWLRRIHLIAHISWDPLIFLFAWPESISVLRWLCRLLIKYRFQIGGVNFSPR